MLLILEIRKNVLFARVEEGIATEAELVELIGIVQILEECGVDVNDRSHFGGCENDHIEPYHWPMGQA